MDVIKPLESIKNRLHRSGNLALEIAMQGIIYQKAWESLGMGMFYLTQNDLLYAKFQANSDDLSQFDTNVMLSQHQDLYEKLA